jgi:hypothetical protein
MEGKIHSHMNTKKLQDLLIWVTQVASPEESGIKPLGKRAIAIASTYANDITYANAVVIRAFFKYAQAAQDDDVYQGIDIPGLIAALKLFQGRIPSYNQPEKVQRRFVQTIIQTWLQAFHLNQEMLKFSDEELKAIKDYLYAIKLLIDCRQLHGSIFRFGNRSSLGC